MQYRVLEPTLRFETNQGDFTFYRGQVINLPKDTALKLIEDSKIVPIEKAVYKVYSKILQAYLWIVETDIHPLRSQGVSGTIYTGDEIRKLKGLSKDSLREINKVKEVFDNSKVEEVKQNEKGK